MTPFQRSAEARALAQREELITSTRGAELPKETSSQTSRRQMETVATRKLRQKRQVEEMRAEGLQWPEIAQARGISERQARYRVGMKR